MSEARNHSLNFNQSKECPVPRASLKRQQQTLGGAGSLNEGQWATSCPPVRVPVASREENANISENRARRHRQALKAKPKTKSG